MKKRIIAVTLALCVLMMALMFVGCKGDKDNNDDPADTSVTVSTALPELKIESVSESGSWVIVETTYGEVRYPYAFSEVMSVNAISNDNSAQLQFATKIESTDVVVYTIYYNEEIGSKLGEFDLGGETGKVSVSVLFESASSSIPEDWLTTFYATQETFNDVLGSMCEDVRFTAAE